MGVCLIPEFEELKFSYDYQKEEEKQALRYKEKVNQNKYNQRIIIANKFQIEKMRKRTLDKNLSIFSTDYIFLTSSPKNNLTKTEPKGPSKGEIFISSTLKSKKYDIINYPKDVVELINKIRKAPKYFIEDVKQAIPMIETYKDKLIYNGNIKVYLNTGKDMFLEAIQCLNETEPMGELKLNEEISIDLPSEKDFEENEEFFKKKILSQREIKKIERYYREAIRDPYIGVLMMIVDDTCKNQGEKRKTILDPNLNKVGIKCQFYGNKFLAYLTFGK
jgi:hypothetical protein